MPVQLYITVGEKQDQCCLQVVRLGGWFEMSANSTYDTASPGSLPGVSLEAQFKSLDLADLFSLHGFLLGRYAL